MLRCPTCALLVVLLALSGPARADEEQAPAPDRSSGRRPVKAPVDEPPPAAEPAVSPAPEAVEAESGEIVKIKRKKKHKKDPDDAAAADAAVVDARPAKRKGGDGQQFGSRRIQVFLVPVGEAASLAAGPAQLALEGEVGKLPGYKPVDLVEELAVPPPPRDAAKMEEARRVLGDGNKQILSHQYEEAASRFRKAIQTMEAANFALESAEYADAYARYGIALQLSGEDEASKDALRMAARLDLANAVDGRQVDRKNGGALDVAREEVAQGPVGALSVVTQPGGARVFLGGVYRGTSPLTIDRAPVGPNYVRLDRPGAFPVVSVVEVKEAFDTPLKVRMKFTPEAQELQKTLIQVPRALSHEAGVPDMLKALGVRFQLERAIFATVEMVRTNHAEVRLCVFDFPKETRLVDEKQEFQVDVEGGLEDAIAKWARGVFDRADKSRNRAASDPLDRSDGTEDWYSTRAAPAKDDAKADPDAPEWERSQYKPSSAKKEGVKSKDPLDHKNGTEDW